MITEKTAQKREAAVLNATKKYFDKLGLGIDYLSMQIDENNKRESAYRQAIEDAIEEDREFQAEDYQRRKAAEEAVKRKLDIHDNALRTSISGIEMVMSEMNIKCEECGAFMSPVQIVCHKCGAFSHIFPYNINDAEKISNMASLGVAPLSEIFKANTNEVAPYHEVQKEFDAMHKIKSAAELYCTHGNSELHRTSFKKIALEAEKFLTEATKKTIEIAVVGNVKAGKSMLINALLGDRMASVDATPETSVLVRYRTTSNKYYTKVSFYTTKQWEALFDSAKAPDRKTAFVESYETLKADSVKAQYLNKSTTYVEFDTIAELKSAIMKWTSSSSPEHFFVSEVELGFISDCLPHDIVLVDTPGLQDPVEFRSNITRDYIKNAHWVLACIANDNLNIKHELEFLNQVCANLQHDIRRLFIVATKADMVEEEDRKKKQKLFLKDIAPLYNRDTGIIRENFISVAAQAHLVLKEKFAGSALSKGDVKSLKKALTEFDIDLDDFEVTKEEIFNKFRINDLYFRLEKKVIKGRRKEIISMIKNDYEKANINIGIEAKNVYNFAGQQLLCLHDESDSFFEESEALENEYGTRSKQIADLKSLLSELEMKVSKGELQNGILE